MEDNMGTSIHKVLQGKSRRISVMLVCAAFCSSSFALELTTLDGRTYENVVIKETTPSFIKVKHKAGIAKISFTNLSDEMRERLGYSLEKDIDNRVDLAKSRERNVIAQKIHARKIRAEVVITTIRPGGAFAHATELQTVLVTNVVTEVTPGTTVVQGGRLSGRRQVVQTRPATSRERHVVTPKTIRGYLSTLFIVSPNRRLHQGPRWTGELYPCGYHTENNSGFIREYRRFATNLEDATAIAQAMIALEKAQVEEGPSHAAIEGLSMGTGFFVTRNGHILTNLHVVKGAKLITIKWRNQNLKAEVLATDERIDAALLKVEAGTVPVPFSAADQGELGQTAFTVGFPMVELQGYAPKVTRGVVSSLKGMKDDALYYQTDLAVQPGNSGGVFANVYGEALGMITAQINNVSLLLNSGQLSQNVNYAVKHKFILTFLR
ncbi:MAG: S1-C subfamily serine protease, partial [Kiritimatiellia bacterium]